MIAKNELDWVDVGKVVRNLKDIGRFIQFDRDGERYLLTDALILRLRWADAVKIQCKTETERRGVWYQTEKGKGFVESPPPADVDAYLEKYIGGMVEAEDPVRSTKPTGLDITLYHDVPTSAMLFFNETGGYIAVRRDFVEMVKGPIRAIDMLPNAIVINGQFYLAAMQDAIWEENEFIKPMDEVTWTEAKEP